MGIPEEDKGPAWLRDYGENSGHLTTTPMWGYQAETGTFAADLKGLKDFGTKLNTELELDYVPHIKTASEYMTAQPAVLPERFLELTDVVQHQAVRLQEVLGTLKNHYLAVQTFAAFATDVATKYGNTDALASTRVVDVETRLSTDTTALPATGTGTTQPTDSLGSLTTPVANQDTEPTGDGYE